MFSYPDFSVVCGETRFYDETQDVVTNPVVIFEILSPSTERYDRVEKFARYQELDSLREYVLISQSEPRVEWYVRQEDDLWMPKMVRGLEETATLETAGIVLPLIDIYRRVVFEN